MAEAIVIGAILRIDLRGWTGEPPALPNPAIKAENGADGTRTFYYDLCPPDHDLTAADLGNRIASRLERIMLAEKSPFAEGAFARRFTLEIGMMHDAGDTRFSTLWPADMLRVLGQADADMTVTHYPFTDDGKAPRSEDDL